MGLGGQRFPSVVVFSVVGVIACSGSIETGTGEDAGTAGDGPGVAVCGLNPCGGELVGTWQATGSCTTADIASTARAVIGQADCRDMFRSTAFGALGTAQFSGDGTFTNSVMVQVDWALWVSDACAAALTSQPGLTTSSEFCTQYSQQIPYLPGHPFESGTCSFVGGGCDCQAHSYYAKQSTGTFVIQGTEFVDGPGLRYPYCVTGDAMTFQVPDDSWGAHFFVTLARQ
jgi:hypothetical protein